MKKLTKLITLFASFFLVSCTPSGPINPDNPDEPKFDTISVEEAVEKIDKLELNVISDQEYCVRGIATIDEKDENGFNGGFLNSRLKFRSIQENGIANNVDEIDGKEVIIFGYLENYNEIYQIPFLPASASPTGEKYNGKLMWVQKDSSADETDVTNISMSPVNKTLALNETYKLEATVYPKNAADKSLTWSSSQPSICSVSEDGTIKGLSFGDAVITATSHNGKTATCNVTVSNGSVTPVVGSKFEIEFNKYGNDGQSQLTSSTIRDQIMSGLDYISTFLDTSKLYKGIDGLKFGSQWAGGSLEFELATSITSLNCSQILVDVQKYGSNSTTVSIYGDDELLKSGSSSDDQIVATLSEPKRISTFQITTSSRAYVSKITFVCDSPIEIPVTGISIPSSKTIATGNSETLDVSYTPSNANKGKGITWTSQNIAIAKVSSGGVVTGVKAGSTTITAKSEGGFTSTCNVTVSDVAVTGISISPTSQSLSIGATKQLTATISPSNASNKTVTWTTSNSSVASVSSSGLVTAIAVGNATITAKSNNGKTATCAIDVSEIQKDAWTIMIYMCGADLESESGLASGDIKEILSVANQPNDVNIVIETGGAKSWSLGSTYLSGATKIDSTKLSRWHVANKKLVLDQTLTYASMGSSSTLQSFVEYGIKEYPAEKTGVIFWNHGGAMYGCCYDEKKSNDSLLNSEMKSAFSKALSNTGSSKLEFVGYDTCLTQVQDIAEFNSNYFNYMIASEEAEAGEGWDYDTWIDDVYSKKPTETILKSIVDGFIADNGGASSSRSDQTLSYLDLTKMSEYKTAFESFASALKTKLSNGSVSKSTFAKWMSNNVKVFCVDSEEDEKYYCLFDVKDMINKLSNNSSYNPGSTYISNLNTAFSSMVKYSVAQKGAGNAYGLGCIFAQDSSYSYYIKSAYTSGETNFSNWLSFLKSYSYLG
ncbi:MAG: Ig-like domain-containing protein [Firmicutes bacterium]|nr:Ig-like domain-containing protein [Candidatus Fiminaster equi]